MCSHLVVAQESGAPQRFNRMSAQSSGPRLVASSVSRLPIPLHDCVAAVRVNADITAKVLTGEVFVLPAPTRCGYCASKNVPHTLLQSSTRRGVIACTGGFCHMDVHVTKCSSCKQWVSRDGRDEHIVLLTLTTAGTVSWARAIAHDASEGTALTSSTVRWLRTVTRRVAAGVAPQTCPTRITPSGPDPSLTSSGRGPLSLLILFPLTNLTLKFSQIKSLTNMQKHIRNPSLACG